MVNRPRVAAADNRRTTMSGPRLTDMSSFVMFSTKLWFPDHD
jgi:hypothetical protein